MKSSLKRILFFTAALYLGMACAASVASGDEPRIMWRGKDRFIALRDMAALYGCDIIGPASSTITLQNKWNAIVFHTDGREVRINGTLVWMHEPLEVVKGRYAIREVDARSVIDPILNPQRYLQNAGYRVVVIDPGHGGQDTGTRGRRGVEEKRAVLDIARRVRNQLASAGLKVYMTREGDRFVELDERCNKARRWGADLFISIHVNSAATQVPNGTETYVLAAAGYESTSGGSITGVQPGNRFENASAILGYQIHRALTAKVGTFDRGIRRSRFLVLREAPCPAVLVECAFLSNPREEEKVLSDGFRESLAQGITRGTLNYLNAVKRSKLAVP